MEHILPKQKKKKHPLHEELDVDIGSDLPVHEEFASDRKIRKMDDEEEL